MEKPKSIRKKYKKKAGWTEDAEHYLLELWADKMPEIRGNRKNSHVYMEIAECLKQIGVEFTCDEVRVKIKNYTAKYRAEKANIGPSGGSPSAWKYYDKIHEMGGLCYSNVEKYVQDSLGCMPLTSEGSDVSMMVSTPEPSPASDASSFSWPTDTNERSISIELLSPESTSPPPPLPSAGRKQSNNFQQKMLNQLKEIESRNDEKHNDAMALQREGLESFKNMFQNFLDTTKNFSKEVLELLKK